MAVRWAEGYRSDWQCILLGVAEAILPQTMTPLVVIDIVAYKR